MDIINRVDCWKNVFWGVCFPTREVSCCSAYLVPLIMDIMTTTYIPIRTILPLHVLYIEVDQRFRVSARCHVIARKLQRNNVRFIATLLRILMATT